MIAITETGEAHTFGAAEVDPCCLGKKKGFTETVVPALTDFRIKRASAGTHHMACFSKGTVFFVFVILPFTLRSLHIHMGVQYQLQHTGCEWK